MKNNVYCLIIILFAFLNNSFKNPIVVDIYHLSENSFKVLIIKSEYALKLYDEAGDWIATYPVVFGNKDLGDKMMQGDKKTPEGIFHIVAKRKHEKWNRFILIDYPTVDSYNKFRKRKADGLIPADAKIGGDIGIHGTWPHEDYAIDQYRNWTEGCVSTKNDYVQELFNLLPVGTTVEIRY